MTDIMPGDMVRCLVGYYKSYRQGEVAVVRRLDLSPSLKPVIILDNDLCDYGSSMYLVDNWEFVKRPRQKPVAIEPKKEHQIMAYEKTKFIAKRLDPSASGEGYIHFTNSGNSPIMDSQSAALEWVKENIIDDEKWLILQTIALVEPKEPVTPVRITVYK